ncbi:MAG: DUF5916 domain-containing protein, partial [Candidatus Zixiibacteriota bacterium]
MSGKNTLIGLGITLFLFSGTLQGALKADSLKTAIATRTDEHLIIDGDLSEKVWQKAPAITSFTQVQPLEGERSSESTVVKIIYDDEALYIGWWCYDSEPDKIVSQLTRRDRSSPSDEVHVRIDSRHDHQTACFFAVNPAGVIRDVLIYNNFQDDDSWDAVWEANAKIHDWGWSAEYKIPYSALKFSSADEYVWGFDLSRNIARKDEYVRWQFVPSSETAGVYRYGHLTGLRGFASPPRLEVLPYSVSYAETEPKNLSNTDGRDYTMNTGLDLKYAINSDFMLDAAINPDFGQVESDEEVVNLSYYETFYEEKRPFFLEGFEIFETQFFNQFYSRRIGRSPRGGFDRVAYYIDYPDKTTILSALKVTGKTKSGASLGLLNATTDEEETDYILEGDPATHNGVVEPLANYSVLRFKQDIRSNSYIGGMLTSANQKDRADAYSGSVDWNLYLLNNRYRFSGQVVNTYNGPGTSGLAFASSLNKDGGKNLRGNLFFDFYDRDVNWNRMGYLSRNDSYGFSTWWQLRSTRIFSIFRYLNLNINGWYNENLDGDRLTNGGNLNSNIQFANNWWMWVGYGMGADRYDDLETRGNGLWYRETGDDFWIGSNTDQTKKIWVNVNFSHGGVRSGRYTDYELYVNFKPITNFEFSIGPSYEINRDALYYVGMGEDDYPVFCSLDLDELDISLRSIYTFTKNLTIQLYTQFYVSAGNQSDFKKLVNPKELVTIDTAAYDIDFDWIDYNSKSLVLNLILRWEYRPG